MPISAPDPPQPPDPGPTLDRLNERQRAFVYAYLGPAHCRATRAAEIAGYRWPGKQGSRLKQFPAVRAALDALMAVWRWERARQQEERWRRDAEESACRSEELRRAGKLRRRRRYPL